jgi:hypothetical protein
LIHFVYRLKLSQEIGNFGNSMLNSLHPHPNNALITQRGRAYFVKGKRITAPSVSEAVKVYYHPFNKKEVLANIRSNDKRRLKADGTSRTDDEMVQRWAENAEYGESLHKVVEDYYNGIPIPEDKAFELRHFVAWDKAKPADWVPYWTEQAIWCPHRHDDEITAGRIDMLFTDGQGKFFHVDWKFADADYAYGRNKSRVYCTCNAWRFGDVECVEHEFGCKAIGPTEQTKHLLMYKWAGFAGNNSLYSEMLRRNYEFNIVESRLVFLHPDLAEYVERFVDFEKHSSLVNSIIGA